MEKILCLMEKSALKYPEGIFNSNFAHKVKRTMINKIDMYFYDTNTLMLYYAGYHIATISMKKDIIKRVEFMPDPPEITVADNMRHIIYGLSTYVGARVVICGEAKIGERTEDHMIDTQSSTSYVYGVCK